MSTPSSSPSSQELETEDDAAAILNEFRCPLTLEIMEDPVMTRLGHSYERNALFLWLQKNQVCPLTRNPLKLSDIITNKALKGKIQEWKKKNGLTIEDPNETDDHLKGVLDSLCFFTIKSDKHMINALMETQDPNGLDLLRRLTKQRRKAKREEKRRRAAAA
jgi:hypothetical protein